jgi:cell division protein FtsL
MNLKRQPAASARSGGLLSRLSRPRHKRDAETNVQASLMPHRGSAPTAAASLRQVVLSFMAILFMAAACVYHLHVRFEGIHTGYETGRERRIQARLLLERRELRLEMASLKEQRRIEAEARQRLGMEVPPVERIVSINKARKTVTVSGGTL